MKNTKIRLNSISCLCEDSDGPDSDTKHHYFATLKYSEKVSYILVVLKNAFYFNVY